MKNTRSIKAISAHAAAGIRRIERMVLLNIISTVVIHLFRIELDIYNGGFLPALCEIGERTRWVKKPKISLKLEEDQEIISGSTIQLLDELPGDSAHHLSWLIKEKGLISIEVGAPQTGNQIIEVELK